MWKRGNVIFDYLDFFGNVTKLRAISVFNNIFVIELFF